MKTRADQNPPSQFRPNYLAWGLVAAATVCFGITSTLYWLEHRPKPPASPPTSSNHGPPAHVLTGLQPPQAALVQGNWYYDHERWDLAIQYYQKAIDGGIDNPNVRTDMGNALRFSNQPEKALSQYQLAQKQDPRHEQSLFNQGALWAMNLEQPDKGIEIWKTYLTRFPKGASVNAAKQLIARYKSGNKSNPATPKGH